MIYKNVSFSPSISLSKLIEWGDHYSVDHSAIDTQHKEIFNLGINVYENWRNGKGVAELLLTVEKLEKLLGAHFSFEERLLAEIGYIDLAEHIEEHHRMLKDMAAMKEDMNSRLILLKDGSMSSRGGSMLSPDWPLMLFFLGFAVGHVSTSDMRYSKALNASSS